MRRVPLVSVLAIVCSLPAFAQLPPTPPQGARPGAPPGAQLPGLPPPRDANARTPQTGTAKVRGRVLASPSGAPLRRAQVTLMSAEPGVAQTRRVTTTDGEGRYEFAEVPAGRFSINATKAGYVSLQYGQRRPFEAGTPVNIGDAQTLERIDFGLPRGSVISARITDEFGEPVAGVMVQVQRYQYGPDGQRRLSTVAGTTPFATTDDRGEFRAFGLMPGEYVVLATMRGIGLPTGSNPNDSNEGFSPTFYPGTISAEQAQAISLGVGEEQAVAFSMVAARMGRVAGSAVDSEGQPAGGASISIVTVTGNGYSSSPGGTVAEDGTFTISGIAPGEHTLRVERRRGTTSAESASVPVTVGSNDVTGLRVTLSPGTRVTGRVIWEGTAARTGGPVPPRVSAQQADPQRQFLLLGNTDPLANGTPDDEGNFTLGGVAGRVFFSMTAPPPGWMVKSVTLAGDDITDLPMDMTGIPSLSDVRVVLTDKLTSLTGQVKDQRGQLVTDYVVVVLGAQQQEPVIAARSIRIIRPDNTGRFQLRGLRPGRYVAAAVEALEQGRQFAPEFQQQLRRGAREFAVGDGEAVTVDLTMTPDL